MKLTRRSSFIVASLLAFAPFAQAQQFPDKPLKIIYTYAAGGVGDAISRAVAESMGKHLGQPVIVDNRTGASGSIGVLAAQRSPADGYTLLMTTVTTVVQVPLVTKAPTFDPAKSLTPLGVLGVSPLALVAHPSVPATDFPSFVQWARKQEQGVDVAVAGPTLEVASTLLASGASIKLVNVPYRGGAPALQGILAGETKIFFNPPNSTLIEFLKQGKLKLLGVTSAEPSPLLPGGEPINKFVPDYVQDITFAMWAPPGLPADITAKLKDALRKTLAEPGMAERFHGLTVSLKAAGPEEVVRVTNREAAGIKRALEIAPIKYQ